MPGPGLEPGRDCSQGILSPSRLPISPSRPVDQKMLKRERPRPLPLAFLRAGNGTRTRDPNLGKVVLYQLSYSRVVLLNIRQGVRRTSGRAFEEPSREAPSA